MAEPKKPRVQLPPVQQLGFVVKDVDKAVEYYSSVFGWGPFDIFELSLKGFTYRGKQGDSRLKIAMAQQGAIQIELIEVLEGETPHSNFLREKGEGVQHVLCGFVEDLDGMLAELAKDGIEPVFRGLLNPSDFSIDMGMGEVRADIVYLNADRIGGVMIELCELK